VAVRATHRIAGTSVSGTGEKVSTGMTALTVDCPVGG
jgi:hypothetical protein